MTSGHNSQLSHALGLERAQSAVPSGGKSVVWESLVALTERRLAGHGSFSEWARIISEIPKPEGTTIDLDRWAPRVTAPGDFSRLPALLQQLGPWKKGPFDIFGATIDAEWRSDAKWDRLMGFVESVQDETILDVGSGNGYFLLRAAGAGARFVLGLEPSVLFTAQYLALERCFDCDRVALLPATSREFEKARAPGEWRFFDTVLSMGVLYHRRSPLDHLSELRGFARRGGRVIVETIVDEGPKGHALVPEGRFAGMKNVWFLPSIPTLVGWMKRLQMVDIRASEPVRTTSNEQRATSWSTDVSLARFLDPNDPEMTIEGHPAPQRAFVSGRVP